ncbi:MAG: hypothetical protein MUF16_24840, partial [Burkholderiaceae bacterium]|nr:hypothetical protein [Burkholderiaceae bacterium]
MLKKLASVAGAELNFKVRCASVAWAAAKPAQGRPRSFGSAVGCADCPAVLASLAWRVTRYAPN